MHAHVHAPTRADRQEATVCRRGLNERQTYDSATGHGWRLRHARHAHRWWNDTSEVGTVLKKSTTHTYEHNTHIITVAFMLLFYLCKQRCWLSVRANISISMSVSPSQRQHKRNVGNRSRIGVPWRTLGIDLNSCRGRDTTRRRDGDRMDKSACDGSCEYKIQSCQGALK